MQLAFTVPQDHSIRAEEGGGRRLEAPQQEALGEFHFTKIGEEELSEGSQQQSHNAMHGLLSAQLESHLLGKCTCDNDDK